MDNIGGAALAEKEVAPEIVVDADGNQSILAVVETPQDQSTTTPREPILDREKVVKGKPVYRFIKRAQDIILSFIALVILAIPMVLLAIAIYIDSPGASPVFKQKRVGLDGKEFTFYKFRSMVPNAEAKLAEVLQNNEMDGPVFKIKEDPRITKFGSFIRKVGLDELMQLINILKGDMSIVGPRPPLPREVEQYSAYDTQRLYVKPGLTCYWQVQPQRNTVTFQEWMDLDVKYIQERNFITDWKIIFMTVKVVVKRQGW